MTISVPARSFARFGIMFVILAGGLTGCDQLPEQAEKIVRKAAPEKIVQLDVQELGTIRKKRASFDRRMRAI